MQTAMLEERNPAKLKEYAMAKVTYVAEREYWDEAA